MIAQRLKWSAYGPMTAVIAGILLATPSVRALEDTVKIQPEIMNALNARFPGAEIHQWAKEQEGEIVQFTAPAEPGLVSVKAVVCQGAVTCEALCSVTVVDSIIEPPQKGVFAGKGLPGYTLESARGKMWRSRYDEQRNVIVINSGHRDFVFAARSQPRKIRYILRLFAKELVAKNFPGLSPGDMMERLIELSLYTEEKLR